MVHIPYKGTPPAMTDLIAGHVQVIFDNLPSSVPLIREKKVRGLAVTTLQPSPIMPELPTVAETLPGYESSRCSGSVSPTARLGKSSTSSIGGQRSVGRAGHSRASG